MDTAASIQAIWLIEEYAKILRKRVWFNPPIPPKTADMIDDSMIAVEIFEDKIYEMRAIGGIFCTVIKIMHCLQLSPCIIGGSQKCRGAAPIFNRSLKRINTTGAVKCSIKSVTLVSKIIELKAWIKKYFSAASEENEFRFDRIKGIKDIVLSSSPSHLVNQVADETAIVIPKIKVVENNHEAGFIRRIKKRNHFIDRVWTCKLRGVSLSFCSS